MSGDARFFSSTKKGEIAEWRGELNDPDKDTKKDVVKKIVAAMTVGKDVSMLFTDVVNCMQTDNVELKKLVYLYLINYAKTQPDLAILAVNTFVKVRVSIRLPPFFIAGTSKHRRNAANSSSFLSFWHFENTTDAANSPSLLLSFCLFFLSVQDTQDPNPLIRALAVRTMGCIRVDKITEYLCDPLQRTLAVRGERAYGGGGGGVGGGGGGRRGTWWRKLEGGLQRFCTRSTPRTFLFYFMHIFSKELLSILLFTPDVFS